MNSDVPVTVVLSTSDYDDLRDLLRLCAVECSLQSELADLAADFRFYCDLLESNRR